MGNSHPVLLYFIYDIVVEVIDNHYSIKIEVFYKLMEYLDSKALIEWPNFRTDLLNTCFEFIEEEEYRKILESKIKELIIYEENSYNHYYKEELLMMLYGIVEKYETEDKKSQFIKENLQYTSFRELLINKLKGKGDYLGIIDLALKGEKKDKGLLGLENKWKKIRYEAYKKLSLKEEQKKLARELLFSGDFTK